MHVLVQAVARTFAPVAGSLDAAERCGLGRHRAFVDAELAVVLAAGLSVGAAKADEWTVTVGCAHCNFAKETGADSCAAAAKAGDKVYLLKGNVAKDFKKGGEYVVKGKISADGKTIEVEEMKKKA